MAHPKRKHSQSRRDKRRANCKIKTKSVTMCPQCAKKIEPHHACPSCGYYRGRKVIEIRQKKEAKVAASTG